MKRQAIYFVIVTTVIAGVLLYSLNVNNKLNSDPVYVIAKVIKKERDPESGSIIYYRYWFKGKSYEDSYSDIGCGNGVYVVIKISKGNPRVHKFNDCSVPTCIANDSSLNEYWENLPECQQ
jgi:hypothetical protein